MKCDAQYTVAFKQIRDLKLRGELQIQTLLSKWKAGLPRPKQKNGGVGVT